MGDELDELRRQLDSLVELLDAKGLVRNAVLVYSSRTASLHALLEGDDLANRVAALRPTLLGGPYAKGRGRIHAKRVSDIYRELRKGREDSKDEPGAAAFYYGEMEMRRHALGGERRVERFILNTYWALSGYALRAWRALATFAVVVLACAVLFDQGGLRDQSVPAARVQAGVPAQEASPTAQPPNFIDALTYSLGTATAVIGAPERPLSRWGAFLRIVLRIVGPVLIALTVLSIRGRVKR